MLRPAGRVAANVRVSPAAGAAKWLETSSENAWPSLELWLAMNGQGGELWGPPMVKKTLMNLPWASVGGVPEISPVAAWMVRPAGRVAANVRVSPAAGAAKWLETSSENAWPSLALWLAITVPVGPVSPTARVKLSLMNLPWASVAVTVTGLRP